MITLLSQLTIIIAGCFSLWLAFRRYYIKSQLDNIPGPPSPSFLQGHFSVFASPTQQAWDFHRDNLEKYGMVVRIKFPLGQNVLQISDPKALYHVLVKDSHIFGVMSSETERNMLVLGPGLISTIGDHHRKQRNMMNPVFSTVHLRKMMPIFYEVSHKLRNTFEQKVRNGPREIDLLSWITRTALELISQSGFGLSMDDLSENTIPHTYSTHSKKLTSLISKILNILAVVAPWIRKMGPPRMLRFLLDLIPWPTIQELKEVVDVLHNTCAEIFEAKKKAMEQSGETGQDLEHRKDF